MKDSNVFGAEIRRRILFLIIIGAFVLLGFQLFNMQILQNEAYDEKSAENSIKGLVQTPLRGVFLDRYYEAMVNNKPSYTLLITPANYDRKLDRYIESVLGVDSGYIKKILRENSIYSKYVPIRIRRGIGFDVVAWYEENQEKLPGVSYIIDMQRQYADGIMGAHLFGYTKEISPEQLEKDQEYYAMGDYIGYNGIEKKYEKYLRGTKGVNYVLVDSRRKEIGKYKDGKNDRKSIKGDDLVLSIDADAQRVAEAAFVGKKGGLVAIEPSTGEIIAFVSSPQYDLNQFSTVTSRDYWVNLNQDPEKPLFNRASMSVNPPGSTFKILGAIAGLEEGVITSQSIINCPGGFYFGRFFKCHGGSHGGLNVERAIEVSCNTFFYSLILRVGLDKWSEYAHRFGFGQKTGIDIGEEKRGILPSTEYYNKVYGKKGWTKGFVVSLGIGQGELSVTPLQLAKYCAMIANNGKTKTPHVVKGYLDTYSKKMVPFNYADVDARISQKTMDIVKHGMFLVVNGHGTARIAQLTDYAVAGKTGTAQNPHGKDHAWFIGFAPFENPKIAVACFVENAGFGATNAAPIARDVIKTFLDKMKDPKGYKLKKESEVKVAQTSIEN